MAKSGAKKRLEDNAKRLALLRTVIAAANVSIKACRLTECLLCTHMPPVSDAQTARRRST